MHDMMRDFIPRIGLEQVAVLSLRQRRRFPPQHQFPGIR